jgi:hypothetical protein
MLPGVMVGDECTEKARYLVADSSATYFGEAIALKAVGLSDSRFLFLKSLFNLKKF